jgi:DNA-binding transcriptional ArsR family regulator
VTTTKRNIESLLADGDWHQAGEIAERVGVTRQTVHRHLRQLVEEGVLTVAGAGRGTRYRRRDRAISMTLSTLGLDETSAWENLDTPESLVRSLSAAARSTTTYAFTELVNNVVDHSGASEVSFEIRRQASTIILEVIDRGIGVFEHIRQRLGLTNEIEALQELSKGKTTTIPDRHSGEGIFFTSKAVHLFEIRSGTLRWVVDNRRGDTAVGILDPPVEGTEARLELDDDRVCPLIEVFKEYAEDLEFDRTRIVVRLFSIGTTFISRSEAKRLLHGLEKFREVVLDFDAVELVGQGFADEVFRVWARLHPETHLIPVAMSEPVEFMVERAIRRAKES